MHTSAVPDFWKVDFGRIYFPILFIDSPLIDSPVLLVLFQMVSPKSQSAELVPGSQNVEPLGEKSSILNEMSLWGRLRRSALPGGLLGAPEFSPSLRVHWRLRGGSRLGLQLFTSPRLPEQQPQNQPPFKRPLRQPLPLAASPGHLLQSQHPGGPRDPQYPQSLSLRNRCR